MIRYYLTVNGTISEIESPEPGCWISLTHPTASETELIASKYGIELNDLRAPLDEEERSRIETEDNYTVIVVDIPAIEERNGADWFVTLPLGIFVTEDVIISVCLQDTPVLSAFTDGRVRDHYTFKKTRFILQILYKNAQLFLQYLRIIDEKTVRLKKLTDDLFEAAKASSGAIPVNLEKIEMISIVNQALAEVGEKLDATGLQILFDRKPEKAEVMADGQLLWRVIENLLTNAAKYAMPSSRVYIDIFEEEEGRVRLEIKNVSREPLNISADELTERFTRGDRSRNTEGSGLGLAIAKDLTDHMGGEFKIYIDGDLFKAAVILERA